MKPSRITLAVGIVLIVVAPALQSQVIPELPGILDRMAEKYHMPSIRAAFGTFTYEYTDLATPFSRWIEDSLSEASSKSTRISILNRNAAAALDPAFKGIYGEFLKETGSEALLHGRFFQEGRSIRVRLELTDLATGTLVGVEDWKLSASRVPSYASIAPAKETLARALDLKRMGSASVGGFKVSVTTDRGQGAAYRAGESLEILVTVNKDAYVRLFHINGTGGIQLIWPNSFGGGDGRIRAGDTVRLPGPSDPFRFLLSAPYGTEFIKAIAATEPFSGEQPGFTDLGTNPRVISSGFAAKGSRTAETAENLASYFIGPGG